METDKISAAFVQAQSEFSAALKDSTNPHFKKTYANIDSVIDAIRSSLGKCGLAFVQPLTYEADRVMISTRLIHTSGQTLDLGTIPVPILPALAMDAQKLGGAITYSRRYHLASALGITSEGMDDDGEGTQGRGQYAPRSHSQPPQQKKEYAKPFGPEEQAAHQARAALVGEITTVMGILTMGRDVQSKGIFMRDQMGLNSFDELKKLPIEKLNELKKKLDQLNS